jgi:hypothetical protein
VLSHLHSSSFLIPKDSPVIVRGLEATLISNAFQELASRFVAWGQPGQVERW